MFRLCFYIKNMRKYIFLMLLMTAAAGINPANGTENQKDSTVAKSSGFFEFMKERTHITGYAQMGFHYDSYDIGKRRAANQFNIYRAMLIAKIEPVKHLQLSFMGDLAKFNLHELYADYRPLEAFGIRFGQYKTPFTIESNMSPAVTEIIRGAQAVYYMAGIDGSDPCFGPGAGRDIGIMAHGEFLKVGKNSHNLIGYSIGVFNGEPFNTKETNNYKDIAAMLSISPVKGLKFVGTCYFGHATALADNFYGAFMTGDTYKRTRWSAGVDFRMGPVYLRSEYLEGHDDIIHSRGGYVTVTGSTCKYLDIIGSLDYLNRNTAIGDWQCNYILGLQWHLAYKCRIQVQYVYQQRSGNSTGYYAGIPSSHLVISQIQLGF